MIGRRLSHYDVIESLGAGGMGEVYRARDSRLHRDVAIKVLPADRSLSETARVRFQREAMAASSLNHPNIITMHEINAEGDTDFIVMEYVRGVTLASILRKRSLDIDEALRYATQIADAVSKALDPLLEVRDFNVREHAAQALERWGTKENIPNLVKMYEDSRRGTSY